MYNLDDYDMIFYVNKLSSVLFNELLFHFFLSSFQPNKTAFNGFNFKN